MGFSTVSIGFIDQGVKLKPHSATDAKYLDRAVSIAKFTGTQRANFDRVEGGRDDGDLIITRADGAWIQGPIVKSK